MHRVGSLLGGRRWTHLAAHEARSRSRPARARRARARLLLRVSACPARRPVAHPHSSHPRPRHRTLVGRAHPCHGKNGTKNELAGAVSAGHARAHQPRLKFGLSRRCSIEAALLRTEPRRHEACETRPAFSPFESRYIRWKEACPANVPSFHPPLRESCWGCACWPSLSSQRATSAGHGVGCEDTTPPSDATG